MAPDTDCDGAKVILNPCAVHLRATWSQLERFLIEFPRAFFVRDRDGDGGHFVCNHFPIPFSFLGLSLSIISLLPSGSCTTAIQHTGLSIPSAAKGTFACLRLLMAASKSS